MDKKLIAAVIKRIVNSAAALLFILILIFIVTRLSPAEPNRLLLSPEISKELADKIKSDYALEGNIFEQLIAFTANALRGNLGVSLSYRQPVTKVLGDFLPFTIIYALVSFFIQVTAALFLVYFSLGRRKSKTDKFISGGSIVLYAVPSFVLGVILLFLFSEKLMIFPASGIRSLGYGEITLFEEIADISFHMFLPLLTLSAAGTSIFYKYLRDNIENYYNADFILRERAEGASQKKIFWKHLLPNAAGPFITVAGIELGYLMGGVLITESLFGLPGIGRLMMSSIYSRDYPVVIGCTLAAGAWMILANLLADLVRYYIDRRTIGSI